VAAVTGGASGIGRAIALLLAGKGVHVAIADVDESGLADVVAAIERAGRTARGWSVDVTRPDAVEQWAADVEGVFGRVDTVWNVAGVIAAGDVLESDLGQLEHVLAVDFWGSVHTTRAFLPRIVASGGGHVVHISSAFGLVSAPSYSAYNAAKFAVRGWSDALRMELRRAGIDVGVTCVYPGATRTPIMARATSAAGPEDARRRQEFFERHMARTSPETVAARAVRGVARGRSRVVTGIDAHVADAVARLTGTGYEHLLGVAASRRRR
jgi:short-subunit dehydrogenase